MSSEMFEKNLGDLVKSGGLFLDPTRAGRARARFLRETLPRSRFGTRGFAIFAAAVLLCVTLIWTARSHSAHRGPELGTQRGPAAPPPLVLLPFRRGNDLLDATLKDGQNPAGARELRFEGRSRLPDRLVFVVRFEKLVEGVSGDRILPQGTLGAFAALRLDQGAFVSCWRDPGPSLIHFNVTAPDVHQEVSMVKQLKVPESEREWSFEFLAWDDRLLSLLGPQLAQVSDLAREVRDLLALVEADCASEALFLGQQKALISDAEALQRRAEALAGSGLYPAGASQIGFTARDLATALSIFKWEDGKFAGPKSYYTNGQLALTFRREPFGIDRLRKYLEEAVGIAGREFDLWILKDVRRIGLQESHRRAVKEQAHRPGVAEFADVLLESREALEPRIRQLSR